MLDPFIQMLTKELEIEGSLATQMPGVFRFPLEEDLVILISDTPPGFILTCNLGQAPTANQEEFYTRCLMGNLFGQGTKGAVIGLTEDGERVTVSQHVNYHADYKDFRDILEDFINTVDFWKSEIVAKK